VNPRLSASLDSFDAVLRRIARLSDVPLDSSHAPPLAEGAELSQGRFVIQRVLGRGGMGTVYEAIDRTRGARVALKSIGTVEASRVHRFKREFRALSDVVHPSLVRLHELFASDGTWFFTMELVDGVPFIDHVRPLQADAAARAVLGAAEPLRDGEVDRLDVAALQRALAQLVLAVQAIHRAGKLHCDLKPSNVLVTPRGQVVVLDFGLTVDVSESHDGGTPAYMAPEANAAPASDWYAVGVMLFEALTGQLPFDGDSKAILTAKRSSPAPELTCNANVPQALVALCGALLERDPARRSDGDAILSALGVSPARTVRAQVDEPEQTFVGRKAELAALRAALDEAERGRLVVCRVHGASGMGKSMLVQQAFRELEDGRRGVVLRGRCHEHEAIPHKLLEGVVDRLGAQLTELDLVSSLRVDALAALVRLFPSLGRFAPLARHARGASLPLEPEALRQLAAQGLCEALRTLRARGPLVIHIDDAQWGDIDGARLLGDVLAPPAPGLLLCIGHRSEQSSASLEALWHALRRAGAEQREVPVGELPIEELRELIAKVAGAGALDIDRLAREGAGMPMFASELALRAREGSSASSLDEAIAARASELPEEARRILVLTAISGVPTERSVLERASAAGELDRALSLLRVQRLVTTRTSAGETWVEPFHDRIREALASASTQDETRMAHAELARALEVLRPDEVERLATHLEACGEHAAAARNAVLAAKRAEQALAFDRAADWYMRAIAIGRFEGEHARTLHFEHGAALAAAERGREAAEALLCAALGADAEETGLIEAQAAEYRLAAGDMAAGIAELVDRGLGAMGLLPQDPARVLETLMALSKEGQARLQQHLVELEHAPHDAYSTSAPEALLRRLDALWSASLDLNLVGEPILGSAAAAQHLRLAFEAKDPLRLARAAYLQAPQDSQLVFGRSSEGYDLLMSIADRAARQVDDPQLEVWRQRAIATAAHHVGRSDLVRHAWWAASRAGSGVPGTGRVLASMRVAAYGALADLARYDEMRACSEAWTNAVRGRYDGNGAWVAAICDVRPALDDTGCEQYLERADGLMQGASFVQRLVSDLVAITTEHYLGRVDEAWTRMRRTHDEAKKMVIPMLARALSAMIQRSILQCELARAGRGHSDAIPEAETALLLLEAIGQPSMSFVCHAARASLAYLRDDRAGALEHLDRMVEASRHDYGNPASGLSAQRVKGRLLGGGEGRRLIERADTGLRQLKVRNPARWSRIGLPAFMDL
jgi:tRNA A-37 threonylcarbamoyl transferase component Bud32